MSGDDKQPVLDEHKKQEQPEAIYEIEQHHHNDATGANDINDYQPIHHIQQLLTQPNADKHPLFAHLKSNRNGPFVWSPGEQRAHKMQKGVVSSLLSGIGGITNIGRHNVPVGSRGISFDNGKLVILGEGNHWMISPNHVYRENISLSCPTQNNPFINIGDQISVVYVEPGEIAVLTNGNQYRKLAAGTHVIEGQGWRYLKAVKTNEQLLDLGDHEIVRVPAGSIGFARNNKGDLIKLEQGEHILNKGDRKFLPYKQNQAFADLGAKYIEVSPYERIRVEGNEVAVISDENGQFKILSTGQHEIWDGRVNFKDYIPLSNIGLTINPEQHFRSKDGADVRVIFDINFKIDNQEEAIRELCNPEECKESGDMQKLIIAWVKERAIDAMAALVSQHNASDIIIVPDHKSDIKSEAHALRDDIQDRFMGKINCSLREKGLVLDSFRLGSGLDVVSPEARERLNALVGAAAQADLAKAEQAALNVKQEQENQRRLQAVDVDNEIKQREVNAEIARKEAQTKAKVERKRQKYAMLNETLGQDGTIAILLAKQKRKAAAKLGENAQTLVVGNDASNVLSLGSGK